MNPITPLNAALWEFPHTMTLKVIGDADAATDETALTDLVCAILARHLGNFSPQALSTRTSSGGRFLSVSVGICVHNCAQVEGIYRDLRAEPRIRTAL